MQKQNNCRCGWLRTRWKQLAVHSLILGAFAFYCFFLAAPLWYSFESIPGQSSLQEISLPAVTDNISCRVDRSIVNAPTLNIEGWAFIKDQDPAGSRTYVVLNSASHTYVFDTSRVDRADVSVVYSDLNMDLDWCGFVAWVPLSKIERGLYRIGVYISGGDTSALQYTHRYVRIPDESGLHNITLPAPENNALCVLNRVDVNTSSIDIEGRAFIQGQAYVDCQTFVVLTSPHGTYIFDTLPVYRPDVTRAYKDLDLDLDWCGFAARIAPGKIEKGVYCIGVYIVKDDISTLRYTSENITK